jgi:hypothetical protein
MPKAESIFEICPANELRERLRNSAHAIEPAIQRLIDVLESAGCKGIVIEKQYVDLDFKAGYGRFYYVHHRNTNRWCERIHFFATEVRDEDLYLMTQETKNGYMGYTVVRPLPTHKAGRTVLNESIIGAMFPQLHVSETRYLTCSAMHTVNLAGNKIEFRGAPWMQQDKLIAACASTAIWTTNWHMCHLYPNDFRRFTTTQITDFAVRFSMATGRGMPSDGLQVEQMVSALHAMGYEPFLKIPETSLTCKRTVYHYIESGIPIIAIVVFPNGRGLEYHAVTIVGHTLNQSRPTNKPTTSNFRGRLRLHDYTSDYVPRFIAQDDSGGPFRFVEFLEWKQLRDVTSRQLRIGKQSFPCAARFDGGTSDSEPAFLSALLVPVPKRVTLQGEAAEKNAQYLVQSIFLPNLKSVRLSFRTFLQPSNNLKLWWEPKAVGSGRPAEVGFALRTHNFPNWVWVTEFADSDTLKKEGTILGQVIQDCSGRGTHAPWDDLVAIIGPDRISLFPPDPAADPIESTEALSEVIKQFRTRDIRQ